MSKTKIKEIKEAPEMFTIIPKLKTILLIIGALFLFQACSTVKPTPFETGRALKAPSGAKDLLNNRMGNLAEFDVIYRHNNQVEPNENLVFILQEVLEELLDKFEFTTDSEQFRKREYWATPSENTYYDSLGDEYLAGDCDEFALHIFMELKSRGIKSRIVTVLTEDNRPHIVVESNGWIVDNRYSFVVANNELDYKWLSISDYDLQGSWHAALKTTDKTDNMLIASTK